MEKFSSFTTTNLRNIIQGAIDEIGWGLNGGPFGRVLGDFDPFTLKATLFFPSLPARNREGIGYDEIPAVVLSRIRGVSRLQFEGAVYQKTREFLGQHGGVLPVGFDDWLAIPKLIQDVESTSWNLQRSPIRHDIKSVNPHFTNVWEGRKPFEVRLNDRDYQPGDSFIMRELGPMPEGYTGRAIEGLITFILSHDDYPKGIAKEYVAMTIEITKRLTLKR